MASALVVIVQIKEGRRRLTATRSKPARCVLSNGHLVRVNPGPVRGGRGISGLSSSSRRIAYSEDKIYLLGYRLAHGTGSRA